MHYSRTTASLYSLVPDPDTKQPSFVTIFSIWNSMMGTSLLTVPWALQQAGFTTGVLLILLVGAIATYTSCIIIRSPSRVPRDHVDLEEFPDVCGYYLGRPGWLVAMVFSCVTLFSGATIYYVLMCNFLFSTGVFLRSLAVGEVLADAARNVTEHRQVLCPGRVPSHNTSELLTSQRDAVFAAAWHLTDTVPLYLAVLILPLLNIRSPTFFTKFTSLGVFSVLYMCGYVIYNVTRWGVNMHPRGEALRHFDWNFPALTGMFSLTFINHMFAISMTRVNRHQTHNVRDNAAGFTCVAASLLLTGALLYVSFPDSKACLQDNILNNIRFSDPGAVGARALIFLELVTVFPLALYLLRTQLCHVVFDDVYPGRLHVFLFNVAVVGVMTEVAMFLPAVGVLLRFSGALCGLVYVFTLPCAVRLLELRRAGRLTALRAALHGAIILLGVLNFIAQFVML